MEELARRLREREIPFDAKDRKIMCLPHVINICCGHVIRKFTNEELADDSEDSDDAYLYAEEAPSSRQTFEEAIKRDPIALGRSIVRVIRASGQRRDSFEDLISSGNEKSWFRRKNGDKETIVQLKSLQLLHDVRTRWDSVFYMLRRLREMRPVSFVTILKISAHISQQAVDCFLALPNNQELAKYKLTSMEWSVLQDFEIILGVSFGVQLSPTLILDTFDLGPTQGATGNVCREYAGPVWGHPFIRAFHEQLGKTQARIPTPREHYQGRPWFGVQVLWAHGSYQGLYHSYV